jgi:soluble lytic murein transglycosylase-like protein
MISRASIATMTGRANRARLLVVFRILLSTLLIFLATGSRIAAGEITTYKDANGRSVYVNSDDHELTSAVERGGVLAALRLIEHRKSELPGIDSYIQQVALQHQIDAKLVHAVISVESAWNPKARSPKGALGLMQLMPDTAVRFGVRDPLDPKQNIEGGVRYLRFLLDLFNENLKFSLAAYNAGEKVVAQRGDLPPYDETRAYVDHVTALYADLQDDKYQNRKSVHQSSAAGGRTLYTNIY